MATFALSFNFSRCTQFYGAVYNEISSRFICTPDITFHVSSLNTHLGPEHSKAFYSFSSPPFYLLILCVNVLILVNMYDTFRK